MGRFSTLSPCRAVIFDLDGTLIDTERIYYEAFEYAAKHLDRAYPFSAHVEHVNGRPEAVCLANFISALKLDDEGVTPAQVLSLRNEYALHRFPACMLMPGVEATIELLKAAGLPHGIATSSARHGTTFKLKTSQKSSLLSQFDVIMCCDDPAMDGKKGKPEPHIFHAAAEALGVRAEDCVIFEDSLAGISAGLASGAFVFAIPDERLRTEAEAMVGNRGIVLRTMEDFRLDMIGIDTPAVLPIASDVGPYAGVWSRTALFEPKDAPEPVDTDGQQVLWVQAQCGVYVDVRVPRTSLRSDAEAAPLGLLQSIKSFAGTSSYDPITRHLVWKRHVDYRPAGSGDEGLMSLRAPDRPGEMLTAVEDGVLPGDEYREIWAQIDSAATTDWAVLLTHCDDTTRPGFMLQVGRHWGLALGRKTGPDGGDVAALSAFFAEPIATADTASCQGLADLQESATQYYACVGTLALGRSEERDWHIVASTRPDLATGMSMTLGALLSCWRVKTCLQGSAPRGLIWPEREGNIHP